LWRERFHPMIDPKIDDHVEGSAPPWHQSAMLNEPYLIALNQANLLAT
jgi:hypothetical protein